MRKLVAALIAALALVGPSVAQAHQWPLYGNVAGGLEDCTFAAAADWIIATKHVVPSEHEVTSDFHAAGGGAPISPITLSASWTAHPIAGYRARLNMAARTRPAVEAQTVPTLTMIWFFGSHHMILTLGGSPRGVRIVTWGKESLMAWRTWEDVAEYNYSVRLLRR